MTKTDFFTFCHPCDIRRLVQPGELTNRINSHGYKFDNVYVIRQRCANDFDDIVFSSPDFAVTELRSEDYPTILTDFDIPDVDEQAERLTHGPSGAHYWKHHVINHLIGLKESTADYIVFSDCDCRIDHQVSSWVDKGMELLKFRSDILIVAPSDGGCAMDYMLRDGTRLTQSVSQQLFMCNRRTMLGVDFNLPWNGIFDAPDGPFAEFYAMLEGRIWRYLRAKKLYRAILNSDWRYWHDQEIPWR